MMSSAGVPPGFRFHPTEEELLHYYLKKKVSFQKFDLEVVREVDLNKMEPWDLQERCRIGSTPQNECYFFSHKDKKYPTGSRTNRATSAGFWKATGRDKCIRNDYEKIGMRKTLVFYQGRAPHGQKTDWIMHEYRLEENEDIEGNEDGWVICRVFRKKNFFKIGNEGSTSLSTKHQINGTTATNHLQALPHREDHYALHQHNQPNLALHYVQVPHFSQVHSHLQLQSQKPPSYDFSTISMNSSKVVKQLLPGQRVVGNESYTNKHAEYQDSMLKVGMSDLHMVEEREENMNSWTMLDKLVDSHLSHGESSKGVRLCDSDVNLHQVNQLSLRNEMDLWSFGR